MSMFDLPKTPANYAPLSPLSFIRRTAEVFPDRAAILHGDLTAKLGRNLRPHAAASPPPSPAMRQAARPSPSSPPTRPPWWRRISACRCSAPC